MSRKLSRYFTGLACWLVGWTALGQDFGLGSYEVISSNRVSRTTFEYVIRVAITNQVATALGLTAEVFSSSPDTVILQSKVGFGDLALGGSIVSSNTITIRQNRLVSFNPSALQWFVTAQSMPLIVAVDTPVSGFLTNGTNVIVTGTVGPAVEGVQVGLVPATLSGNQFSADIPLEEGRNTISVLVTNRFGGTGLANVLVTRDTAPPIVNIEAPADGVVLASRQVTVSGLVNDAVPGTVNPEQASVEVNGLPAMVLNRSYAIPDLLLAPGKNVINVVAHDRAGNESHRQIEVTVLEAASQKRLVKLAGEAQTGTNGLILPDPLVIELVDGNGVVQTNQPVTFRVTRNDGLLLAAPDSGRTLTLVTDDHGQASVLFQLGSRTGVGNNQVAVSSPGALAESVFCANGISAPPAKVSALIPETQVGQVGTPLALPWTAYVSDAGGNPVEGTPVVFMVFQGEGSTLEGATTVTKNTDSDGRASVTQTLGTEEGINNNVVLAMLPGLTDSAATFTASARAPQRIEDTRVTGLVLDNANRPMSNILCIILGTTKAAVTDEQGQFVIPNAPVGALRLLADARDRGYPGEWHSLEFNLVTVPGRDNSLDRPIYMLPLDSDSGVVAGGDQDVTLHLKGFPGSSLTILAHSLRDANGQPTTNRVTWTQVNAERVPMTPPMGSQPVLTTAIQPAGLRFNPPAKMCIPNAGLPAGQILELYGFDHDIGAFVSVGTATVSLDGSQICSDPGFGVVKSGWFPVVPPKPPCAQPPPCSAPPQDTECVHYETIPAASNCDCPTYKKVPKNGPCDDHDDCTINDRCQNGVCKGDPVTVDAIDGPCVAAINAAVTFTVTSNGADKVKWTATGGTPASGTGGSFAVTFAAEGDKTVTAYCGSNSKTKTVTVGPDAATVVAHRNEEETAEAPDAGNFGQVKRKSHSAVYKGVVSGGKWCFRLDEFKEKHAVGTQALGCTDIGGANAAAITPATVCAIISDLTPPAVNAGHGPPRGSYYSSSITLSHEHFHVSDFRDKVVTPTMNDLRDYVQQASKCTDCKSATPAADFDAKMETLWSTYQPTYFDGKHEVRAHNHSNPQYATLIQAIRARITSAPAAEGWPNCP